jgi:hypothetical protein
MRRVRDRGIVIGALALAGAGILLGAAVTRAMVGPPRTTAEASTPAVADTEVADAEPSDAFAGASDLVPGEVIRLAAERAPFEPDRRAPAERYQLPGERVVERPRETVIREPPPMPPFRVLGTVGGPEGGVVVIEAEGESPRVFATGDQLLGFTVKSVEGDAVVVSSEGWDVSLSVEAAQATAGSSGRDNDRGRDRDAERAQERQERALEQARERLQELARQMQEQGGGPVRMEIQGDRAIIVGPNGVRREIALPGGDQGNVTFRSTPAVRVRPGGGL